MREQMADVMIGEKRVVESFPDAINFFTHNHKKDTYKSVIDFRGGQGEYDFWWFINLLRELKIEP